MTLLHSNLVHLIRTLLANNPVGMAYSLAAMGAVATDRVLDLDALEGLYADCQRLLWRLADYGAAQLVVPLPDTSVVAMDICTDADTARMSVALTPLLERSSPATVARWAALYPPVIALQQQIPGAGSDWSLASPEPLALVAGQR